jgi:hypothetical protein
MKPSSDFLLGESILLPLLERFLDPPKRPVRFPAKTHGKGNASSLMIASPFCKYSVTMSLFNLSFSISTGAETPSKKAVPGRCREIVARAVDVRLDTTHPLLLTSSLLLHAREGVKGVPPSCLFITGKEPSDELFLNRWSARVNAVSGRETDPREPKPKRFLCNTLLSSVSLSPAWIKAWIVGSKGVGARLCAKVAIGT